MARHSGNGGNQKIGGKQKKAAKSNMAASSKYRRQLWQAW